MKKRPPRPLPEAADLTAAQVAAYLGMSMATFRRLDARRQFPRVEAGPRFVRYPKAGLDLWRAAHLRGGPGERAMTDARLSQDWRRLLPAALGLDLSPVAQPKGGVDEQEAQNCRSRAARVEEDQGAARSHPTPGVGAAKARPRP